MGCCQSKSALPLDSSSNWSSLPCELLELIIPKLGYYESDLIRFKSVCKSWQSADAAPDFAMPLFVLSTVFDVQPRPLPIRHVLWEMSGDKIVRKIDWPRFVSKGFLWNFTRGWFVGKSCDDKHVFLVKYPFLSSRLQIRLPHIDAMKILTSSDPLDPNCIFFAMARNYYASSSYIAFCRAGYEKWRILNEFSSSIRVEDTIFYNNHFYVLDGTGKVYVLMEEEAEDSEPNLVVFAPSVQPGGESTRRYLVETSENLLQVIVEKNSNELSCSISPTCKFHILKLNFDTKDWEKVGTLGDNSLLMSSRSGCYLVSTNNFPRLKSNCIIYFDKDCCWCSFDLKTGMHDKDASFKSSIGIFSCYVPGTICS